MPTERLSMRKIKEILRLHAAGHSQHHISRSCGLARSTVAQYLQRAAAAGLQWPLPESLDEAALEQQLFPSPSTPPRLAVSRIGPACTRNCAARG